jgi:hypothetical protein
MTPTLTPTIGRTAYQWIAALLPFLTGVLIVLQQQLGRRELDPWALGEAAVGLLIALVGTLIAAQAGVARAGTEAAESEGQP